MTEAVRQICEAASKEQELPFSCVSSCSFFSSVAVSVDGFGSKMLFYFYL